MDLRFGEFMKDLRKENGQRVDNRRGSRMTVSTYMKIWITI